MHGHRSNSTNPDDYKKFPGHFLEQEGGLGIYHAGARLYDPEVPRFYGVDAMRWDYPGLSSYVYVANNPLIFIDPFGNDIWVINQDGQIIDHIVDDTVDAFQIVDSDGNIASIEFEYGTVEAVRKPTDSQLENPETGESLSHTLFEIAGDENALALFEFFANPDHTNVEWTHAGIGTSDSGRNVVGTSHLERATGVGSYLLRTDYTLRFVTHNHPSGNLMPSPGDMRSAQRYHSRFPNSSLSIYTKSGGYSLYNEYGPKLPRVTIYGERK